MNDNALNAVKIMYDFFFHIELNENFIEDEDEYE